MAKDFEITYSPANWDAPPGGVAQAWSTPYGGLNVQAPENQIGPSYSPSMNNIMLRNSEMRSRPAFRRFLPGPDGSNAILGQGSFLSRNNVWHTFAFTINGLFQLQFNPLAAVAQGNNPWTRVGGPPLTAGNYVRWRVFQSILYYTNGSGHLSAWDGAALTPINDVAFLGTGVSGLPPANTTLIGGLFLGELDSHLIVGFTSEIIVTGGALGPIANFPQRIRWSNTGFNPFDANGNFGANLGTQGATFDPLVFVNAGFNDFLDVPDQLTGFLFIGRVGYLLRQNGITEVSPTGNGSAPFDFNHMWASEQGIGNVYPSSVAQYGSIGIFVATDNVYQIMGNQVSAIGGGARDAIFADIANTSAPPTAVIVPAYTLGFVYLTYKLYISLPNGATRVWVYSLEENNWSPWTLSNTVIGIPSTCWIGQQSVVVTSQQTVAGAKTGGGGGGGTGGGGGGGVSGGGTGGGGSGQRK